MLASYCRMTYSLAVVMLETTQSVNLFLPIIITVSVAYTVSKLFNRSLYDYALRAKQLPVLRDYVPKHAKKVRAWEIMTPDPLFVEGVMHVDRIAEVIDTDVTMFPVLNMTGNVMGVIPKNFLIVLLEQHNWYVEAEGKDVTKMYATHEKHQDGRRKSITGS